MASKAVSTPLPAWLKGRLQPEPAASRFIYNTFFKYSPTYMTTVMLTATFAGLAFDNVINGLWDMNNRGVRARPAPPRPPETWPPPAGPSALAVTSLPRAIRGAALTPPIKNNYAEED